MPKNEKKKKGKKEENKVSKGEGGEYKYKRREKKPNSDNGINLKLVGPCRLLLPPHIATTQSRKC
jgi:hypothetical protein